VNSFLVGNELAQLLTDLAEEVNVPPSKYEEASDRYTAVADWLNADGSPLADFRPTIYPQGSFALGTAVKPLGDGDYDVDAVCLLESPPPGLDQRQLKSLVGARLESHATYGRLLQPEGRRCWTLKYADTSRFHLDVLPAIPHPWLGHQEAIHITDNKEPTTYWGDSNPKGYLEWFKDRMKVIFAERRKYAALAKDAKVEDIPDYEVRTPLQLLVQIIKRHRDLYFGQDEDRPISIIITTLAASAYDNEEDLYQAMVKVIPLMRAMIKEKDGVTIIPNPVIASENFADKWQAKPRKRLVFDLWLSRLEVFGADLASASTEEEVQVVLDDHFGKDVATSTMTKVASRKNRAAIASGSSRPQMNLSSGGIIPKFLTWIGAYAPPHRERPHWVSDNPKHLQLNAWVSGGPEGRRPLRNGEVLPRNRSLYFEVLDQPAMGETVYWQVVNTGQEAMDKGQLRGDMMATCKTSHEESTLYVGNHWIECFFVKMNRNGTYICTGRTREFVVCIS
jgi:hypothetical protein